MNIGDEPEAVEAKAVESRWRRFAEAIYGSIFVTGLVGALSEHNATARAAAVSVVSTTAVFWLAHVWAELLAERAATGKPGGWPRFLRLAWQEWPIVEAGVLPFLALALAWAGVYANGVGFDQRSPSGSPSCSRGAWSSGAAPGCPGGSPRRPVFSTPRSGSRSSASRS